MAVVRNIKTNDAYKYLGDNVFKNLRTGVIGEVTDEAAQKTFKINIEATELIKDNPVIEEMIKSLNLKFEIKL